VEDYPRAYPQDAGAGIQAFASIPIVAGERVIGVINLVSKSAHVFSLDEREVLTSIGREVGSAVERLQFHEQANFYLDLMTHDINNANTAAIGYAVLLEENLRGPEKELARKLATAIRQSAEIIENVSTIRRLMEEAPAPRPVSLDPVVRSAIGLFPDADIRYVPQGRWVAADDLLPAVFSNLIGNAVKFGEPSVSILITVREEDVIVAVSVEDTGPGIPDAEKTLVFEKFRRGGRKSGKGLGLYIVRTLVERYGGRIRIEDRVPGHPEEGAAFRFTLRAYPPVTGRED
jgi:signal transduction histidine kinase